MRYRYQFIPRDSAGKLGELIDITPYMAMGGVNKINQTVESSDFSLESVFDSLEIKLINDGRFSLGTINSIFSKTREGSIFRVVFINDDDESFISFQGLINDSGTYEDETDRTIELVIVGLESLFSRLSGITIRPNSTFREALFQIFDRPDVKELFDININEINLLFDETIDDVGIFNRISLNDAITKLLFASNSLIRVIPYRDYSTGDRVGLLRVLSRDPRGFAEKTLSGGDHSLVPSPFIFEIKEINTGRQRLFNKIKVNDEEVEATDSTREHGIIDAPDMQVEFINSKTKLRGIGNAALFPFKWEREELEVVLLSSGVQEIDLLDIVAIDVWPFISKPTGEEYFPLVGEDLTGKLVPYESGKRILPSESWIVYEKEENPQKFNCVLKLRKGLEGFLILGNVSRYGDGSSYGDGTLY